MPKPRRRPSGGPAVAVHPIGLRSGGAGRRRRPRCLAPLGVLLLALCFPARSAAAAEVIVDGAVTVPAGATVRNHLYLAAGTVEVLGDIDGDLTVSVGFLNVVGDVTGGVTVAAGRAEIRGTIGRSVRAAGATVAVYGRVEGDVVVAGGLVTIVEGASIGGDVIAAGGAVTLVDGASVAGDVRGYAASLALEGRVRGDVRITARRLLVAPGARIDGALRYRGPDAPGIQAGATIAGPIARIGFPRLLPGPSWLAWRWATIPRLLLMLGLGAVLVLLLPRPLVALADGGRGDPVGTALLGVGVALFVPLLLLLFAILVVGLPVALLGAAAYVAVVYASQALVGLALGRAATRLARDDARRGPNLAAMALGVLLLGALRLVPVPAVGVAVAFVVAVWALGIAAAAGRDRLLPRRRGAPPARPAIGPAPA